MNDRSRIRQDARTLRSLERQARTLLAKIGKFSEGYDSARTMSALGHVSQAIGELTQAAIVAEARAR